MNKYTLLFSLLLQTYVAFSQENPIKLKLGGYIRTETLFDTYRSAESRDGESYQYPLRRGIDASGKDTNSINQFEMLALQSRFRIEASGLTALGAKVTGTIEADFMGSKDQYKYNLNLRHAFVGFQWTKTQLLLGQYWSPLRSPIFVPNTVLFGSGCTFQPQARAVQARLTYSLTSKAQISGVIMAHSTHHVAEPDGINSQRLSGLPDMLAQFQYGDIHQLFFSVTGGYKFLRPYISYLAADGNRYKSEENVGSYYLQACLGYQFPFISAKFQTNLGENMTNYGMIGGYSPIKGSVNQRGEPDYSNISTMSLWSDFETTGNNLKFGLFAGYSENLGTKDDVEIDPNLVNDPDIKQLLRISPRMYIISGPVDIGFEYIMNSAVYGSFENNTVTKTERATINNRILVSVRYSF